MDLSPTSLVVCGGTNRDAEALKELIEDAVDDGDGAVLSVFCGTPLAGEAFEGTLQRICVAAGIPHGKVLVARAGDIWAAGVTLEWETDDGQAENHYHVRFDLPVEESQVHDFIACFTGPIPNPTGGKRGRTR